jgi:hypothetical protein
MRCRSEHGGEAWSPLAVIVSLAGAQVASAQGIQINVTLTTLDAGGLDDGLGDSDVEAYGTFVIGPKTVKWNKHTCEPRFGSYCAIGGPPPYTTRIASGRRNWSDMFLSFDARGFRTNNNIIFFTRNDPKTIAQPLTVSFRFKDHDANSGDDVWCRSGSFELVPAGRTIEDWVNNPVTHSTRASGPDGFCTVGFQVSAQRLSTSP